MKLATRFLIVFLIVMTGLVGISSLSGYLFYKNSQLKQAGHLSNRSMHDLMTFRQLTAELLYTDTIDDVYEQWREHYEVLQGRLESLAASPHVQRLLDTEVQQDMIAAMLAFWDTTRVRLERVDDHLSDVFEQDNPSRDGLVYQYHNLPGYDVLSVKNSVETAALYLGTEFEDKLSELTAMINREIGRQTHAAIRWIVIVNFVISMVVVLVLSLFLSGLNRNLRHWHDAMEKLGKGRFPERLPAHGADEFSRISDAINRTSANLYAIRTELEDRISELSEAKKAAESADRAKSLFLANMGHELRTPLNAIIGFSGIVMQSGGLDEAQKKRLSAISRNARHLLTLINDVLTMSKIEAGKEEINEQLIDLNDLLIEIQEMFSPRAESKGLAFSVTVSPGVPSRVTADAVKLRQILINLIQNALKFTRSGGIEVSVYSEAAADLPGGIRPAVCFEVADTGCGIEEGSLASVFESFEQAQADRYSNRGTGLGLAISRQFVTMMGGVMGVESELAAGSTFWFKLPLAGASIDDPALDAVREAAGPPEVPAEQYETAAARPADAGSGRALPERMRQVPEEILEKMAEAAAKAEIDELNEQIDAVGRIDRRLASVFSDLADNFAYDRLIELLRARKQ